MPVVVLGCLFQLCTLFQQHGHLFSLRCCTLSNLQRGNIQGELVVCPLSFQISTLFSYFAFLIHKNRFLHLLRYICINRLIVNYVIHLGNVDQCCPVWLIASKFLSSLSDNPLPIPLQEAMQTNPYQLCHETNCSCKVSIPFETWQHHFEGEYPSFTDNACRIFPIWMQMATNSSSACLRGEFVPHCFGLWFSQQTLAQMVSFKILFLTSYSAFFLSICVSRKFLSRRRLKDLLAFTSAA